jgi:hypothetical protein
MAERVSQVTPEIFGKDVSSTRISQLTAELLGSGVPITHVSQLVSEILRKDISTAHVSQLVTELFIATIPSTHFSQIVLELFIPNIEVFMPLWYPTLPGLGYSVHWRPKSFNMPTVVTETGARLDLGWSDSPLDEFELTYDFLRGKRFQSGSVEFLTFMGFWRNLNGNLGRFLFRNPYDNTVTRQLIGTTDGITHEFPLVRTFGYGKYSVTENVGYVDVTCPFNVYLGDVKQPQSSYTVDTTSPVDQMLDFKATPTTGQKIYVDMSYGYYCSFTEDTMDFEAFMNDLWSIKSAKFSSNRADT